MGEAITGEAADSPPPLTKYTFFPDPAEQLRIAECSPQEIADVILSQPDLTGSFLHECWRTNRTQAIYDMAASKPVVMLAFSKQQAVTYATLMHTWGGESLETCEAYLRDTIPALLKGATLMPYDAELPEEAQGIIDTMVEDAMDYVTKLSAGEEPPRH